MNVPSADTMRRYLTLLALFGCARADATPDQLEQLAGRPLAMLRDHGVDLGDVVRAVFDIMGPGWDPRATEPAGWGSWLQSLLDERRAES